MGSKICEKNFGKTYSVGNQLAESNFKRSRDVSIGRDGTKSVKSLQRDPNGLSAPFKMKFSRGNLLGRHRIDFLQSTRGTDLYVCALAHVNLNYRENRGEMVTTWHLIEKHNTRMTVAND